MKAKKNMMARNYIPNVEKNNESTKASKREPLSKNNNADNQRVLPWEDIIPPKNNNIF